MNYMEYHKKENKNKFNFDQLRLLHKRKSLDDINDYQSRSSSFDEVIQEDKSQSKRDHENALLQINEDKISNREEYGSSAEDR